jgi:hypothetical protein
VQYYLLTFGVVYGIINTVKREVPTRDTKMGDEVHRVKKVRKKKNSLLTNPLKCDIIKVVKRGE